MPALLSTLPARARWALLGALVIALALAACGFAVFNSHVVSHVDMAAFYTFVAIGKTHGSVASAALRFAQLCDSGSYTLLVALALLVALVRGRPAVALVVLALGVTSPLSSEVLKHVLTFRRPPTNLPIPPLGGGLGGGSWPSGHSTAGMTIAFCWVLASPTRLRPVVAVISACFGLGVVYSVLVLGWHFPSDTLGGIGVALFWTLLAVAAVDVIHSLWGRRILPRLPRQMATARERRYARASARADARSWIRQSVGVMALLVGLMCAGVVALGSGFPRTYGHWQNSFVAFAALLAVAAVLATGAVVALVLAEREAAPARDLRRGSGPAATTAQPRRSPTG